MIDDKEMRKKFSDKKFLKSNEFVQAAGGLMGFFEENKVLVLVALIFLVFVGVAIPGLKWHRSRRVATFAEALYAAEHGLKKDEGYSKLLADFDHLPASVVARLKLVDHFLDHKDTAAALKSLDDGLTGVDQGILPTLLILKKIAILKGEEKYAEAAQFAEQQGDKVFTDFRENFQLAIAQLYLLSGDKIRARGIYEKLAGPSQGENQGAKKKVNPTVATEAMERLLLLDLGVL